MQPTLSTAPDGTRFRDLNGNGVMDPYEDPRLTPEERTADLLARLSLEEKAGLMFQTVIELGDDGDLLETPGAISKSPTSTVILGKGMSHFNVHHIPTARAGARWSNNLQRLAEQTPHGIPVTISTDPRHAFVENTGVAFSAGPFSQWPEPMGLAALDDLEVIRTFADVARQEYCAVGIRAALHPQIDLPTEPRWGRQAQTFGYDAERVSQITAAYLEGFQGDALGPESVACTTKHFPGGGPQRDGEDAHFPYGREQDYPGGMFEYHLAPFREAIRRGTAGMMPTCCGRSSASAASWSPTGSSSTTTTSATRCSPPARGVSSTSTRRGACACCSMPASTSSAARSAWTCCWTSCAREPSPRSAWMRRCGASCW